MSTVKIAAVVFLSAVLIGAVAPSAFTASSYDTQHRLNPNERPSTEYLLGTDELGRDRFARLLYGARTSLLLAPAAALIAVGIAALAGIACASFALLRRAISCVVDLMLSTPLFFLLLIIRALLPLDASPMVSVSVTFALLGLLGWAPAVRVFAASIQQCWDSDFVLQARANGASRSRVLGTHIIPTLAPVLWTQFCILVPVFVLAESNLSVLGLGVSEPLPSLGNLMTDLLNYSLVLEQPWLMVPAALLVGVTGSLQLLAPKVNLP